MPDTPETPEPIEPTSSRGRRIAIALAIIAVGMAAVAAVRWHSFTEPIELDEAVYMLIAQDWLDGGTLYASLWDNKPVGTFLLFRVIVTIWGVSETAARSGGMVAALLTVPALWACLRRRPTWQIAVGVCLIWPLLSAVPSTHMNASNMEVFLLPLFFAALALTQVSVERRSYPLMYAAIACVALAFTMKQVALPFFVLPAAAWWLAHPLHRRRLAAHTVGGAALAVSVLFVVYGIAGFSPIAAIGQQLDSIRSVETQTQPFLVRFPRDVFTALVHPAVRLLLPLTIIAIIGLIRHPMNTRHRDIDWSAVVFCVLCVPATFLPGRLPHYLILLLPAMTIGAILYFRADPRRRPTADYVVAAVLVIAIGAVAWTQYFSRTPEDISRAKYGPWFVYDRGIGRHLQTLGLTDSTVFIGGTHAPILVYSGNRPATKFFNEFNLRQGVISREDYIGQLVQDPPPHIVLIDPSTLPGMQTLLDEHYQMIGPREEHYGAMIYQRRY